jgi:hypothetical protein
LSILERFKRYGPIVHEKYGAKIMFVFKYPENATNAVQNPPEGFIVESQKFRDEQKVISNGLGIEIGTKIPEKLNIHFNAIFLMNGKWLECMQTIPNELIPLKRHNTDKKPNNNKKVRKF